MIAREHRAEHRPSWEREMTSGRWSGYQSQLAAAHGPAGYHQPSRGPQRGHQSSSMSSRVSLDLAPSLQWLQVDRQQAFRSTLAGGCWRQLLLQGVCRLLAAARLILEQVVPRTQWEEPQMWLAGLHGASDVEHEVDRQCQQHERSRHEIAWIHTLDVEHARMALVSRAPA